MKVSPLILSVGNSKLTRRAHIDERGFTLVEVMAVLVIIGLMSSAVVLSLPDKTPAEQSLSAVMLRDLNLAAQSSIITGQPRAFELSNDTYAVSVFKDEAWHVTSEMSWPDDISLVFEKDGANLELTDKRLPLVIFEPTGQSSNFTLTLSSADTVFRLQSRGDGRVVLEETP